MLDVIDKYAAIEQAELGLQRLMDRYRSAVSRRLLSPYLRAWVSPGLGIPNWICPELSESDFAELDACGGAEMFTKASVELEAAIDLLIAGDRTSVRAASIAGWAALETLFADESDYGELATMADRAADILTCLYVRDAYWSIATGHARAGTDELAEALRDADASGRATMVEGALGTQEWAVSPTLGQVSATRWPRKHPSRGSQSA